MSPRTDHETRLSASSTSRFDAIRLRRVIADCARRRAMGEAITDEQIVCANPDLMPALERELSLLRIMQRAASHVADSRLDTSGGPPERPLTRVDAIPGYALLREIHRGGQGVVFEAEQTSTRRRVAVKLLHRGPLASSADRARFRREVELLVRLQHPNIVAVHDTGRVGNSHFIVMDLIVGETLDRFSEGRRGGQWTRERLRETLGLFAVICDAVHAAHLRGIIHRDLKPGNILVDSSGAPHILDFGLAKDIADAGSDVTDDGQFVGSIPWASPEQVRGSGEMDIRSDVYSLGVVAYQLLTGSFPYQVAGPIQEIINTISGQPPGQARSIRPELDADIDTILLKCLDKTPERRYQSAAALAADVRHYLAGEAIDARRDSTAYLLRRALKRHRGALAGAAAGVALLVGAAAYYFNQARINQDLADRERRARISAEDAGARAVAARFEAESERETARLAQEQAQLEREQSVREAERAQAVTAFLVETLGLANPDVTQSPTTTTVSMLEAAAAQIDRRFAGQPASEAAIRATIGNAFAALGELDLAAQQLERALELHEKVLASPPETVYAVLVPDVCVLEDLNDYRWRSRWWRLYRKFPALLAGGDAEFSKQVEAFSGILGSRYQPTAGEAAYAEFRREIDARFSTDDPRWLIFAELLYQGGTNLSLKQAPSLASRYIADALELQRQFLPETNTRVIRTLGTLMTHLFAQGRYEEALSIAERSLVSLESLLPPDHWLVTVYQCRRAACRSALGDFAAAEPILVAGMERLGEIRNAAAYAREMCGYLAEHFERRGESELAAEWRTKLLERIAGADQDFLFLHVMAALKHDHPRLSEALYELREAVADGRSGLSPLMDRVLATSTATPDREPVLAAILCEAFWSLGKSVYDRSSSVDEDARRAFEEAIQCYRRSDTLHPYKAARALFWHGYALNRRGKLDAAETVLRESLPLFDLTSSRQAATQTCVRSVLGDTLSRTGRIGEGEELLLASARDLRGHGSPVGGDAIAAMQLLIQHFERQRDMDRYLEYTELELRDVLATPTAKPSLLDRGAWRIAKHDTFGSESYELARTAAEAAVQKEPSNSTYWRTLGASFLRLGRSRDAVAALTRAEELHLATGGARQPLVIALMIMAHHQDGDFAATKEAFLTLRSLMQMRQNQTAGNRTWARRAAEAIGAPLEIPR
ncbi:MAG: hypothetical protein AMXMBFR47_34110 [Planctomycetota bacterium]